MEKKFYEEIGAKIKECRKEKGITQGDLAKRLTKTSATYINLIESGKRRVSIQSLIAIAKALNAPLHYFLEDYLDNMDSEVLLSVALMTDYKLTSQQREIVIDFVDMLHKKNKKRTSLKAGS